MKSTRTILAILFVLASLPLAALVATTPVRAAPNKPLAGGTFTVNSNVDNTTSDSVLTLREALYIARGGTGASPIEWLYDLGRVDHGPLRHRNHRYCHL